MSDVDWTIERLNDWAIFEVLEQARKMAMGVNSRRFRGKPKTVSRNKFREILGQAQDDDAITFI